MNPTSLLIEFFILATTFTTFAVAFTVGLSLIARQSQAVSEFYQFTSKNWKEQFLLLAGTQKQMLGFGLIGAAISALVALLLGMNHISVIGAAGLGVMAPRIFLNRILRKRKQQIDEQFQPSLVLLVGSLRAGLNLPQAIESLHDLIENPLKLEYAVILREMRIGVPVEDALHNFARRTDNQDILISVNAMLVSIRTGANLADAFQKISETIRSRKALSRKINAMTFQGRAQGLLGALAPIGFGFLFFTMDPVYMSPFLNTTAGTWMLVLVGILIILSYISIQKITTVRI